MVITNLFIHKALLVYLWDKRFLSIKNVDFIALQEQMVSYSF